MTPLELNWTSTFWREAVDGSFSCKLWGLEKNRGDG